MTTSSAPSLRSGTNRGIQLRCGGNKLHGIVVNEGDPAHGVVEVSCSSRFCGKKLGVVVLHRFNLVTGEYTTYRYSEPPTQGKKETNGSCG